MGKGVSKAFSGVSKVMGGTIGLVTGLPLGLLGGSSSGGGGDGGASAALAQMNQQEADRLRMVREQNERAAALEAERRRIAQGSYLAGYQDSTAMSQRTLLGVSS